MHTRYSGPFLLTSVCQPTLLPPRGLPRPSFLFSLGRIWLEESPGDPWIRTIHPSGGGLCAPPHPSRGFLSVACGAESSRPSRPGVRASVPASCHDATEKRSLFPGGLPLPEVLHVRASAPLKSSFSAPEEARASPGLVPVSGASRCSHCLMMSLLWSSPCCRRVACLKVRILTNLGGLQHQLLVASVCTHGAVDGVAELSPTLQHLCVRQSALDTRALSFDLTGTAFG